MKTAIDEGKLNGLLLTPQRKQETVSCPFFHPVLVFEKMIPAVVDVLSPQPVLRVSYGIHPLPSNMQCLLIN